MTTSHLLNRVKVIEFCQVAAGPFCGMLLADYGADVIKIEPLQGDSMRSWPPQNGGYSENFASLNRGKRSIALDLKSDADLGLARRLVLESDVLVENNRPGVMSRLGLGWDWFSKHKPSLIYCSISAFGQTGPRSREGGFDVTIQAATGVMSVTGEPDGAPVKCGVPLSDFTAGLYAAFSISAMLTRVRDGGAGGHIDVPMFATTIAVSALQTSEYFGSGVNPRRLGSAHPRNAPYQAFAASDAWFVVAAGNNRLWSQVCSIVERSELVEHPDFATPALRAKHQGALFDILSPIFLQHTALEWLRAFQGAGVPCAPINNYQQALSDPQAAHLKLVEPAELPGGHMTHTVACPVWIDGRPVPVDIRMPELDEHGVLIRERSAAAAQ
jgi:crotonobetainyl-CoA:carnitine CoA-transferase CaiB-like acyl-CoA transferase